MARWISAPRLAPYLSAAGGHPADAVRLYQWNARLSAALLEALHYVEVVVRNAIDHVMAEDWDESRRGMPWFLMPVLSKNQAKFDASIERVRSRLRPQSRQRETRDQIVAGTDFGFWTSLFDTAHEDLWRSTLHRAFPGSSGKRKDVVTVLQQLRLLRNRLAHHDSLLAVDAAFRLTQMQDVLGWVAPDAAGWLAANEQVTVVLADRPLPTNGVVVVAARDAWPLYLQHPVYVCQPGRSFQHVDHIAFYVDREIKPEILRIRRRVDNVDWSPAEVNRLRSTGNRDDAEVADAIGAARAAAWVGGRYQVFLLTRPGQEGHVTLPGPVPHTRVGKGSAFVQGQRYAALVALRSASSTDDVG